MQKRFFLLATLSFAFLGVEAALALKTAYVSFDHPEGWRCELSQGVWICQSGVETDRKESVVLSIATLATDWDKIENYEEYLKKPRTIQDEDGNTLSAEVKYVRKRNINGFFWIDSLQLNSELPGFWARYLATVQNKYAILITYIVSEERYKQMAPQFERMVASLVPNRELDLSVVTKQGDGPIPGAEIMGPKRRQILESLLNSKRKKAPEIAPPQGGISTVTLLGGVLVLVLAGIVFVRRVKSKRTKLRPAGQSPSPPRKRA